jgi:uncharacterized protein YggL (DUF469 family)
MWKQVSKKFGLLLPKIAKIRPILSPWAWTKNSQLGRRLTSKIRAEEFARIVFFALFNLNEFLALENMPKAHLVHFLNLLIEYANNYH